VGPDRLVIADSGILGGGDIVANLAAGADFTLVGRAYLYGLMAGGQAGVTRALEILERELRIVMALLGVSSLAELHRGHVRFSRQGPTTTR
jgi:isopentenyl diphosphate isomerase/L-lactate dehydrogenase-like FMN-dependent dehydrogenase